MQRAVWLYLVSRRENTTTQMEVARRMGIAQSTVAKLELRDADFVRLGDLCKYAAALGLSIKFTVE